MALGTLRTSSLVVILMFLLTIEVHGQCPVSQISAAFCSCNFEDNNRYQVARSVVCSGMDANTALVFIDTKVTFVDLIVESSTLGSLIPFMFSRLRARNFFLANSGISGIDANAFIGAEDYIESLDLSHNDISTLPPSVFTLLHYLKILNLSNNRLTTIFESTFEGLSSLSYLNLGRNNLNDIRSKAFSGVSSLRTLLMDSNSISDVRADVFTGLDRLEVLHLSANKINSISDSAFYGLVNLRILYLPLNNLTSLKDGMLRNNDLLEELSLKDNHIRFIPENMFFQNKNLKSLDLSYNNLMNIDRFPFKKLGKVERLYLQHNRITKIYKNVFEDLNNVQVIDLSDNKIQSLEENGLAGLVVAETVRLDNNEITVVPYGIFDAIGNVVYLNLSTNRIKNFEDSVPFLANSGMKELDLSWNQIKEVPPTLFQKTRALKKLTLAHNDISMLYPESFSNLQHLEELDLSFNRINNPNGTLFYNCGKLKSLKISWNPLHDLPRSFMVGLNALEEVNLDHTCLDALPDGLFTPVDDSINASVTTGYHHPNPLANLKVAHLASNFLTLINSTHLMGANLTTLDIQENEIAWVDPLVFSMFPSLAFVNISRNALSSSIAEAISSMKSVKLLDLSHNDIHMVERRTLEFDTSFDQLYLEGNPIQCDCNIAYLRVYDNLVDYDTLQCGPSSNNGTEDEIVVCFPMTMLGCPNWPSNHYSMCNAITEAELLQLSEKIRQESTNYNETRLEYKDFCIVRDGPVSNKTVTSAPNFTNTSVIDLPEITKITPSPDHNFIRVEWRHRHTTLVSGYRLRFTNTSNNATYTSELINDRLWYVLNDTSIDKNYLICIEMVLLDGQVQVDESQCRQVGDLVIRKVSEEADNSGLLKLLVPIIVVASVLIIVVLVIIAVRISLRRKRHRDKQQEAMTAAQKMNMWDFPFQPPVTEELVEQTILPYDVYSETIIDPKFHQKKKAKSTVRGNNKTKRVKRRKSKGRQIPSVTGSIVSSNSAKTGSVNSTHSINSLDDVDGNLFMFQGHVVPPPYSANGSMTNGSLANGSLANGSVTNGSLANGSLANGSANGSLKG